MNLKNISAALFVLAASATVLRAADDAVSVRERLKSARTPEERRGIMEQARQSRKSAVPSAPAKAADPAERRRRMEEKLKNDPERLKEFRLRESLRDAGTPEARESIRKQLEQLRAGRAAAAEAALTPEQKAARAKRETDIKAMQTELAPLKERLSSASSEAEKTSIRDAMRQVREKYSKRR